MTLSVLIQRQDRLLLRNPSLEIENAHNQDDAVIQEFRTYVSRGGKFFCPHCYDHTQSLEEVLLRNPEHRRVHFYHPHSDSTDGCSHYSPESEKHKNAKAAIANYLRVQGLAKTVWNEYEEEIKRITLPGVKRHPDLLALMPNGALVVHEVQVSQITPAEIRQRTEDYREAGVSQVVWYLAKGQSYTRENRQVLRSMSNVICYRLFFKSSDANFPTWKEDDRDIDPKQSAGAPSDACSKKGGLQSVGEIMAADPLIKWIKKHKGNPNTRTLKKGAIVQGAPGRCSENWTGVIVGSEPFPSGQDYYQVRWHEREFGGNKTVEKTPVIGNTPDQLKVKEVNL